MSDTHSDYDFAWCPGCGDFGVRRALESALERWTVDTESPVESNVVIAGIGCSGNMVHLLEGPQPYGFHGIHGRTLPIAMGVKGGRPDLNVVVVAGDGDFLGIGLEHIAPQAARNLDVTAVVMDNGVYGLTKGQSSPTTALGAITNSTPYGKPEAAVSPFSLYLSMGVTFVASGLSTKVKELADLIYAAMKHPGFAIVHVQSPCTTYNNTFERLKGSPKKGIEPLAWDIGDDHDPTDVDAANRIARSEGIPLGLMYRNDTVPTFEQRLEEARAKARPRTLPQMLESYAV